MSYFYYCLFSYIIIIYKTRGFLMNVLRTQKLLAKKILIRPRELKNCNLSAKKNAVEIELAITTIDETRSFLT